MRVMSNKDGAMLSHFDNINENDIPLLSGITDLPQQLRDTPHQKRLIDNHLDANKGKIKVYFSLEAIFGFSKVLKR